MTIKIMDIKIKIPQLKQSFTLNQLKRKTLIHSKHKKETVTFITLKILKEQYKNFMDT